MNKKILNYRSTAIILLAVLSVTGCSFGEFVAEDTEVPTEIHQESTASAVPTEAATESHGLSLSDDGTLLVGNQEAIDYLADMNMWMHPGNKNPENADIPINGSAVELNEGIYRIPAGTFYYGGLESIKLPDSLCYIEDNAFNKSALKSISIPKKVSYIGEQVFGYSALTNISVAEDNEYYSSSEGVLFNKSKTKLLTFPCMKTGSYYIPNGVTSVESYAFCGCSLDSIKIPSSLTRIEDFGFCGFSTKTEAVLNIPDSVTHIGTGAFDTCENITSIKLPGKINTIEPYTFYQCSNLTSLEIPEGVKSIGNRAFGWCFQLKTLKIPSSVTYIGEALFEECGSGNVDIYYAGSEKQWKNINNNDDELASNTNIHFNSR